MEDDGRIVSKNRRKVKENGSIEEMNHQMRNCKNGGLEIKDICCRDAEMVTVVLV